MKQYKKLIQDVIDTGEVRTDRTGVGTISIFGYQSKYDLSEGFPIVTIKKTVWKPVVAELLWFLEGSTDERRLAELTFQKPRNELTEKNTIWTANANEQGVKLGYRNDDEVKELGPVYGYNFRNFNGFDQLKWLVSEIEKNPNSRRLILSCWNANRIEEMALPPCHTLFHFYVSNGKLSCQLYQRSADIGLGVPFNIASYALLTSIVAKITNLEVGEFVHTIGDAHIYTNHINQLNSIVENEIYESPVLSIDNRLIEECKEVIFNNGKFSLDAASYATLIGYKSHPHVNLPMAV